MDRVAIGELEPDFAALVGQVAYLQLAQFETASAVAGRTSDLKARENLTRVAAAILQKHHDLIDLLAKQGVDPTVSMRPFTAGIDRYRRRLANAGWAESVLTLHLTTGILDDFFSRLAAGLPGAAGQQVADVIARDPGHEALVAVLTKIVVQDPRRGSRLAMWGRRLVGDTLLVARSALDAVPSVAGAQRGDDVRVEPVLSEIIAQHTRRMDALGLTA